MGAVNMAGYSMKLLPARLILVLLGIYSTLGPCATAAMSHPFHTSSAEMDWNPQCGCWEVSLRLVASDLELALQRLTPKLRLDSLDMEAAQTSRVIQDYIQSCFFLTDNDNKGSETAFQISTPTVVPGEISAGSSALDSGLSGGQSRPSLSTVNWVGQEIQGTWIWLYFELVPSTSDHRLKLVHQVLADVNVDQLNIVSLRIGQHRHSVQSHSQLRCLELDTHGKPADRGGTAERDAGLQPADPNH